MRARRSSFSPRRARKAERAFRVRIGRNVWLRMKVEDTQRFCFGVSFFNFHSRAFSGALLFIVRKNHEFVANVKHAIFEPLIK